MDVFWDTLPFLGDGEDVISVRYLLQGWFDKSTPEQQARGDVACAAFKYVCILPLDPDLGTELDMKTFDPFKSVWFLFYYVDCLSVRVLGGIDFWALLELRGHVSVADLVQNRGFFLPWDDEEEEEEEEEGERWFYLPCVFPEQKAAHKNVGICMDVIEARVRWIVSCENADETSWTHGNNRVEDYGAMLVAPLVSAVFDGWGPSYVKTRQRYDRALLFAEHSLFMGRMTRWFRTEGAILGLMCRNGLRKRLEAGMLVDPTPADNQAFALRHPRVPPPTWYCKVPLEEVPYEIAMKLPLRVGGGVSISYKEFPAWIWAKFLVMRTHARTRMMIDVEDSGAIPGDLGAHLADMAKVVHGHFADNPIRRGTKRARTSEQRERLGDIDPSEGFSPDIEDLWKAMPPCLAALRSNARFPKHLERLRLTQTFQEAGMSLDVTGDFFEALNNAFPHPAVTYRDSKARFNHEEAWKSNIGPVYCGNLVRNAVNNKRGDVLKCPFVDKIPKASGLKPGDDYKPTLQACKQACAGQGKRTGFAGPHHLLRKALK